MKVSFTVNGRVRALEADPHQSLASLLRGERYLGVRDGCDGQGACGACTVLLDDEPVNACLLLAAQVEGRSVKTIEHFSDHRSLSAIQSAFVDTGVVQCGYCTPAMVLSTHALLERSQGAPTREDIKDALSGVFCRCTARSSMCTAPKSRARPSGSPKPSNRG